MKQLISICILALLLPSCKKDDKFTGKLKISFPKEIHSCDFYDIGNRSHALFTVKNVKKETFKMNPGNYYCVPCDFSNDYPGLAFQIQTDNTTWITYGENSNYRIEY